MMKTQCQSPRLALRLSAVEATQWCRLGFQVEDDSQDQHRIQQILQIDDAADCAGSLELTCMKCQKRVSQHLHNLSPFSLHSMIEVFAKALHATLYLITPWQYPPRLGIRLGLACYSISCHALPVSAYSAEAWHAIHLLRLGIPFYILSSLGSICHCPRLGILFYILSRLGNIC